MIQPFGAGDIIFTQTIAHRFIEAGYHILWPVMPQFVDGLQRAYPQIEFTDYTKSTGVDFNAKVQKVINGMLHVPLRWSMEIMKVPYTGVMRAKYDMYGYDWQDWKQCAMWHRDHDKEAALFAHLGLKEGEEYILTNKHYRSDSSGVISLPKFDCRVVEMKSIPGFSLFDWQTVIHGAKEIHTVSTALLYLLEMLDLKQPIHLYKRVPEETHFDNVQFLFSKPYILH